MWTLHCHSVYTHHHLLGHSRCTGLDDKCKELHPHPALPGPASSPTCLEALLTTMSLCEELGVPVAEEKTEGPDNDVAPRDRNVPAKKNKN